MDWHACGIHRTDAKTGVAAVGSPRPTPVRRRGSLSAAVLAGGLVCALVSSCTDHESDSIARLRYSQAAMGRSVLRRIRLLSAGVALRGELAVDRVWTDVLGNVFIARTPDGAEGGITAVHCLRNGVRRRDRAPGIHRAGRGLYRLDERHHIVDVFTPWDRHVASVVTPCDMSARRIMEHLGIFHRKTSSVDRMQMDPDSIERWRELLPVVVRSDGYGPLYVRSDQLKRRDSPHVEPETDAIDTTYVVVQRYDLIELPDFVLVGRSRPGALYRHVFTAGGRYIMTAVAYGDTLPEGRELLQEMDLVSQDSSARQPGPEAH